MNVPVITLEVRGMKHVVHAALMKEIAAIDKYVFDALERICNEDNIRCIVDEQVKRSVNEVLKASVEQFFRYGKGHESLKNAAHEYLDRIYFGEKHEQA